MFVVWRGWGWLVALVILLVIMLGQFWLPGWYRELNDGAFAPPGMRDALWGVALLIGALVTVLLWILVLRPLERGHADPRKRAESEARFRKIYQDLVQAELDAGREPDAGVRGLADGTTPMPEPARSSLFWLPVRFWPVVFAAIGVLLLATRLGTALDGR